MAGIFLLGHIPMMWNVCIPVFMVILLNVVGSYETYLMTMLCHMAFEGHISFWHICGNNMFPVT